MRTNRKAQRSNDRGFALLLVLMVLALLSAIAAGLVLMSSTETNVNYNFRAEQVAYFAAKAGAEEMRDRMSTSNANPITLPTTAPTTSNAQVIYLINEGSQAGSVKPWDSSNAYFDTELCHEGYPGLSLSSVSPDIPCASVPSGNGWYNSGTLYTSTLPWNGTSAALPFKWARVTIKLNNSVQKYPVNPSASSTAYACWNGSQEFTSTTACTSLSVGQPVYTITALAVTNSGARKMVQEEVSLAPGIRFPYALEATGTGCSVISLSGTVSVDSYTTQNGGTYASTKAWTGGNIATNGNTSANGTVNIGGNVGSSISSLLGGCTADLSLTGNAGLVSGQTPPNSLFLTSTLSVPTPASPTPAPPTGTTRGLTSMVPGTYADITLNNGTLTMAPGTYNINSLTVKGNGVISISPAGQVILNVAGSGQSTPIDLSGGSVSNTTNIASNFQIYYGGTGAVKISGGSNAYMVVDAPNAPVTLVGNSDIYGASVGASVNDNGNVNVHYDRNLLNGLPASGPLTLIGNRELYF